MSTRKQTKNKQALNDGIFESGSGRPSSFRRAVAWITLVAYVGQPLLVTAQTTADQAAAANKRPVVDVTANGIPLVQIATPNAAGLSHNQYNQFNVDPAGLILNNSQTTVQTQQAGYVAANPNLVNGAAHVILNEVTGTTHSQLNGHIEVAGQQAEVIVANPNGITCNGCGFINANRGVFTTGTPVIGASGSLDSFRVTGGDIQIGSAGLNGNNLSQLDLIARSVQVNGQLWGTNLNVITGANLVDYNTLGVQVIQGEGVKPTVGIDVALLGGMYANKIRLIGTEAGVGVNSLGTLSAQAGDFNLDYQGQITLNGNTNATGNLSVNSNTGITNGGTLYSQQTALLTSTGNISNIGLLSSKGNLTLNANSLNSSGSLGAGIDSSGFATQTGNLLITTTQGQTTATGQNIAGGNISITATDINLANSNTNARSGITLTATAGNLSLNGAWTQTTGDIVLNAAGGAITNNQGLLTGSQITSHSANFNNVAGEVYAVGNLEVIATADITNSGALTAMGNLTLNAANLSSTGTLGAGIDGNGNATQNGNLLITTTQGQTTATGQNVAGGSLNITATDINLANSNTNARSGITLTATAGNLNLNGAWTQTTGDIVLNASGAVTNDRGLSIGSQVTSHSASFSNTAGEVYAGGNLAITTTADISNSGSLTAMGNLTLDAASLNSTGTLGAGIDGNGTANRNGNITIITGNQAVISGQIVAGILAGSPAVAGGNLSITATDINLANSNTNARSGITLTATAGNIDFTNAWTQTTGDIVLNATGAVTNDRGLLIGSQVTSHSHSFSNTAGEVYAGGNLAITTTADISNSGSLTAMGNLTLDAASLNSTGTLGAGIDGNGTANRNGNITIITGNQAVISGQIVAGILAGSPAVAGGNLSITATDINLANSNTNARSGITLTASAGNIDLTSAWTQTTGDIVLDAIGAISNNRGLLLASNITSHSASFSNLVGDVYAGGNLEIITTSDISNSGSLTAMGNLTLHAANLNSTGTLGAGIDGNGNANKNGNISIVTQNKTLISGQVVAGRLTNGLITDGGNLDITATNINLANSNANAVSGIILTTSAGNIDLTGALTQSAGDIILAAAGSVLNDQGKLYGAAITITSAGFSNTAGNVHATGDLNITSSTSFTNGGTLYSKQNTSLTSTNTGAGTGTGSITNTIDGQVSAQGNLTIHATNLTSAGTLASGIDANGNATQNGNITIITASQTIISGQTIAGRLAGGLALDGGNLSITANDINLANSTTNVFSGIKLHAKAGNIDLTSAWTQSVGDIVLIATGSVNNTAAFLFGANVTSNSDSFINNAIGPKKGLVSSSGKITLTANSIDNTNGQIAGGNITLDLNTTGNLANAGGLVSSDTDLLIIANTISGNGQIVAGNDAKMQLQGDYTNAAGGNVFKVNRNLTISTTGNFTNQTALEAVGAVTIEAVNIDNQTGSFVQDVLTGAFNPTGAYINGNTINLIATAGNLTNQGILNARSKVTASGKVISNTASIFGGSISLAATQLIENVGPAAIIGARDNNGLLELLAPTIQNRDDTTTTDTSPQPKIIGLGQVVLAGGVDAQNQYTNATQVLNQSGLIQSGGNMAFFANTLTNTRRELTMSDVYTPTGTTVNGQGYWTAGSTVPGGAAPFMGVGGAINSSYMYTTYTGTVSQNSVLTISPVAHIMSGGDIYLHVNTLQNYWSQIAAIGNIPLGGVNLDQNSWRAGAISDMTQTTYSGDWVYLNYQGFYWNYSVYACTGSLINYLGVSCSPYAWGPQTISTPVGNYESSVTSHGNITGNGGGIHNVAPSSATTPLGAQSQSGHNSVAASDGQTTPPDAVSVAQGGQATQPGSQTVPQGGQATQPGSQTVPQGGQATLPGNLPAAQPPALNNLTLPPGGLYLTSTAPQSPYLIETNPAFTNHAQWLSSDWYFTHANIDPDTIQRRLGDGFYEQQLIRDELMSLTGRTLLSAYGNEQEQFMAMMTSGAQVAVALGISPGIGLTADQASQLTSNVIIMETREVQGQKVLVPVVYLAQISAGDLLSSGPLIAANNIILDNTQGFTNSGTIRANNILSISGQSIDNRGGNLQSGGLMRLNTVGDIDFTSANVQAGSLALNAGGNLLLNTGAQQISMHNAGGANASLDRTGTLLGRIGSLNVAGDAVIQTGGNFELNGARLRVGGDLATDIKGNWLIGTQQIHETTTATAQGTHSYSEYVQHIGSVVQVGGQSNIQVGNNLVAQGAQINLQGGGTIHAAGDVKLGAAKDSFSSDSTGVSRDHYGRVQSLDETLIGTNLQSGQGLTISSGRDTTISSSTVNVTQGNLTLAATGNVNIVSDSERHESSRVDIGTSHGLTTTTQRTKNDETWRSDSVGSSIAGDNVNIISGNDINIVGSNVTAEHNLGVAAVNNVNISAATDTYGSEHYSNERTSGLQATNAFSITDQGPETTSHSRTDGTNQSYNRSGLTSNSGNLTIVAGGNLVASGADLVADAGALALSAGGTVAILAGQDTLTQDSSTQVVTNPNAFTKQRKTTTDSSNSIDSQGSTLSGNSVTINSGADIVLQGTQVTAGNGGIALEAGGDIQLLAAVDSTSSSHQETLATDGYTFRADGSLNDTDTRRKNNKAEHQTVTNQVTSLVSGGNITTHSGGNTLIQASTLDAQGVIDLSAGNAATYNEDGSVHTEASQGTITFAGIKDSTYTSVVDSSNSMPWQSASGHGEMVETLQLANIHAGKGLTVDATGGIVVDIPVVPATPAPEPQVDAQGNIIPAVPLTPEQQATQQQTALDNHIQTLAGKPGQEWIGQLAQMAKEKPDAVKLQQVNAAAQHWDYAHEGLTSEAAAVIVIVVTYFTAGAGSSAVGTSTAVGGTTTTTLGGATLATTTAAGTSYTALGAAINAGFSTLASQAAVSIINNQGDIGQTLNDLGKSENVKATIAAMLSAGIGQGLANTQYMGGVHTSANTALSTSSLLAKLELNLINTTVNTAVNSAVYGTSFTNALGTNLQNAGIDTLAAVTANVIGQSYKGPDGYLNGQPVLHDLAHAALGCASAAARRQDCASGALGGLVGEVSAELIGGTADGSQLTPEQQGQVVFLSQLATAGAAITTGSNLSTALGTSQNAVVNNYLTAAQVQQKLDKLAKAKTDEDKKKIDQEFDAISQANNDAGFHDLNNHDSMAGFQLAQDQAGLTTLLTGPTTCANDSACRMAVNNNLNELQGVVDGHNAIEGFFNVIPAVQMAVLPVSVVGEAAASLFGAGRVTATSSSTALSTYRYTQDGETFFHYGYAQQAGNFAGGLRPGGYATNIGGLTGSEAQAGLALPHATAPDAVYVVSPQPGTLVRVNPVADAKFGQSGGLPEFQFPAGTHSGTVSQPRALP